MTQEKVVRIIGYYKDPSYIERVIGVFRKLLMDIDWIQARKVSEDGLFEIYMGIPMHSNFEIAIQNLSKTVNVEKVEILEDAKIVTYIIRNNGIVIEGQPSEAKDYDIVVYKPVFSKVTTVSWGMVSGKSVY